MRRPDHRLQVLQLAVVLLVLLQKPLHVRLVFAAHADLPLVRQQRLLGRIKDQAVEESVLEGK